MGPVRSSFFYLLDELAERGNGECEHFAIGTLRIAELGSCAGYRYLDTLAVVVASA